jgi:hypothetical protein
MENQAKNYEEFEVVQLGEQRLIQGPSAQTQELHNVSGGDGCIMLDGKWCYKPTMVSVNVPNERWVFVGEPFPEVVQDNQGAAGWNGLDRGPNVPRDKFSVTLNNPDRKEARILSGSRSFFIRLVCIAEYRG